MRITSGPVEVLESGTVMNFHKENLTFHLADDFLVTFKFLVSDRERPQMSFEYPKAGEIVIVLDNFHQKVGIGTGSPLVMGKLDDKTLLLSFRTYNLIDRISDVILHYTFFLREEENNG